MNSIVSVQGLTKQFGDLAAVQDVSFTMEENKIYGLLGRNGAGKTTMMQMMTAQLFSTSGEIKIFGEHPYENEHVLNRICFIKESQKYPDMFRVRDVMNAGAALFSNWDQKLADELVELYRLPKNKHVKKLSRGMLSSVGIIIGIASRAPLTIFDEPYLGLDAVARTMFYEQLMEDYMKYPRTIILSTHLIDEISHILEHILIMDEGKLIMNEDADLLRGRAVSIVGNVADVENYISGLTIIRRERLGDLLSVSILDKGENNLNTKGTPSGIQINPLSMQQLFVYLTGRQADRKAVHAE